MASNTKEVSVDMSPLFVIYKDGSINRLRPQELVPVCNNPQAPIQSKDVIVQQETGVSVRLYLPKLTTPSQKLPLVIYIHGGAFCMGSARSPTFHNFITSLVEKTNFLAVSVDYRLAPEVPFSVLYDDSWEAVKWVLSHANGNGQESWLNEHADFGKVFIGGESAGANIANDVVVRAGVNNDLDSNVKILGLYLVHPYFGVENDKLYDFLCPTSGGCFNDPRVNPLLDPRLKSMACKKVLFFLGEKDFLKEGALSYYEGLKKSEWHGQVEIFETKEEGHCFHFSNPMAEKAVALMDRLVDFLKQD